METAARIMDFIRGEVLFEDDASKTLTADTPLLDGIIDSLSLMQLVAFLEEEFEVEVDDAEITDEHFRTVGDMTRLVNGKIAGAPASR